MLGGKVVHCELRKLIKKRSFFTMDKDISGFDAETFYFPRY
jgi:hypothetical protein